MRNIFSLIPYFIIVLFHSTVGMATELPSFNFSHIEVPVYQVVEKEGCTALTMGYAKHKFQNLEKWTNADENKKILEIDLVFTRYPLQKEDWKTNYDTLLNLRIQEVINLLPGIEEDKSVKWNLVLQTDCRNEADAKKMFHGAVIKYRDRVTKKHIQYLSNVRNIITGKVDFEDSVVFKVFDRNQHWNNMLIVNDWTGSMYDYGAQAVLWHRLNMDKKAVKHILFFNDGDGMPDNEKVIGQTGGIYSANAYDVKDIVTVMKDVMVGGNGGDVEENDIEALLFGIKNLPDFDEILLIADNNSPVRDMSLAQEINMPVRIILCGSFNRRPIHPDYLELAKITNGSLHTIDKDIYDMASKRGGGGGKGGGRSP